MKKKRTRTLALVALQALLMAWVLLAVRLHRLTFSTVGRGNLMLLSEALLGLDSIIAVVVLVESRLPASLRSSALLWTNVLGMIIRAGLMGGGGYLLELAPWLALVAGVLILVSALQALKLGQQETASSSLQDLSADQGQTRASKFASVVTIMMALGMIAFTNLDNMAAIIALSRGDWLLIGLGVIFNLLFPFAGSDWVEKAIKRYWWAPYLAASVLAALAAYIVASWLEGATVIWISLFAAAQAVLLGAILWPHRSDVWLWLCKRRKAAWLRLRRMVRWLSKCGRKIVRLITRRS